MTTFRFLAALAAGLITCAATAQTVTKDSALPAAQALTGAEGMKAVQGSGCASQMQPCANVLISPAAIGTYLAPTIAARVPNTRQVTTSAPLTGGGALSGDLTLGIAAATSSAAGTMSATDKAKLDGIATGATANTGTVTSVSATGANGVTASVTNAGTTPAIAIGLGTVGIANGGTGATTAPAALSALGGQPLAGNLSALAGLGTAADNCSYWTGSAAAALYTCPSFGRGLVGAASASAAQSTLGLGSAATYAIGTSGATVGLLNGSNTYSGAMTFSQAITGSITGNAGTASKWATARTLSVTGDTSWTLSVDGSGNATATSTLASSGVTAGTYGAANAVPSLTIDAKGRVTAATTGATLATVATSGLDTDLTGAAWTAYNPSVSASQGGFTTVSTFGRYKRIGKTVFVRINIVISTNGNAGGYIIVGLPFSSNDTGNGRYQQALACKEVYSVGYQCGANIGNGAASANVTRYDAAYPGGDNYTLAITGTYEAA